MEACPIWSVVKDANDCVISTTTLFEYIRHLEAQLVEAKATNSGGAQKEVVAHDDFALVCLCPHCHYDHAEDEDEEEE